jgi:hypothetical protein
MVTPGEAGPEAIPAVFDAGLAPSLPLWFINDAVPTVI